MSRAIRLSSYCWRGIDRGACSRRAWPISAAPSHDLAADPLEAATFVRDTVLPAMASVREAADTLETLIADDLWPLPTYQEMLYIG